MKHLYNKLVSFFATIQGKIAFYPTLFSVIGFLFAMLMLILEDKGISAFIINYAPALVINNADTAETLLSFLTGGIISIMVFSFSMVMVLLNQASTNYSPRVLPGLISNRKHQYVLGIYLATILYNTFTLVGIDPKENDTYQLPGFSVLVGIIFTVICFGAFLYFIHSISQAIQINTILDTIFLKAKRRLLELLEKEEKEHIPDFPDTSNWKSYYSNQTGYFQKMAISNLIAICEEHELKIKVLPIQGVFVLKGIPIIKTNKEIDEEVLAKILSNFNFARGEFVEDNYALAFKQITEIGVKAMSPGINDPGTAINTIDYLTELFALRLQKNDETIIAQDNKAYIYLKTISFAELLYQVMVSYRTYCKADVTCVQKLFIMLKYLLLQQEHYAHHTKALHEQIELLYEDATKAIENPKDIEKISILYQSIRSPKEDQ